MSSVDLHAPRSGARGTIQVGGFLSRAGLIESYYGRDRRRPYMAEARAGSHWSLSDACISRNGRRPSRKGVPDIMAQSWLDHVEIFSQYKARAHGHG